SGRYGMTAAVADDVVSDARRCRWSGGVSLSPRSWPGRSRRKPRGGRYEVTSNRGDMVDADGARGGARWGRDRPGEAVVAVPGRGPRPALQHGGQEDQESVHTAGARREEVEHLRLLPAHEGRLLDRGRLWCGRGVTPTRRENAAGRGGRLHEPAEADQSERGLRLPGGQRRRDRRDLRDWSQQAHRRDP